MPPPLPTGNVMTLTLRPGQVKKSPPELRVLARQREIVLKGDPANTGDIRVSFFSRKTGRRADPKKIFVASSIPPLPIFTLKRGQVKRLKIKQNLPIQARGTFSDSLPMYARGISLKFDLPATVFSLHEDWHIEC
ncbi:MAG: hypothetical protein ACRD8O_01820 [Bryobacteraceae bacterium]